MIKLIYALILPNFHKNTAADNNKNIDPEDALLLETVHRLIQLGLAAEQIAQALDLELPLILQNLTKQ